MEQQERHLSIQELSRKVGIPKSTLRFWEKKFEGILVPLRTRGGQRRYSVEHILIIKEIKKLRDSGMSLSETKRRLTRRPKAKFSVPSRNGMNLIADRIAEVVRSEVYNLLVREGVN